MVIIRTIGIQNITSIMNRVDIDLGNRITILIGPNNSGKSNILESFEYALNTLQNTNVGDEIINKRALATLETLEEPEMHQIASIEVMLTITDSDRASVVEETIRILMTEVRAQNSDEVTSWDSLVSHLQDFSWVLFPDFIVLLVSLSRRADGSFHFISHWENFLQKWQKEIQIYEKIWKEVYMKNIGPYSGNSQLNRFIMIMYNQIIRKCAHLPKTLPAEKPTNIVQGGFGRNFPTPDKIREYLVYINEPSTRDLGPPRALETIVDLIKEVFTDITDIIPSFDISTGQVKVLIKKENDEYELGTQGDGLKQLLMSIVFMYNQNENLLVMDEPENHLHPKLEPKIVDFFLTHGKGQLVIATHSEAIVSSVPEEAIANGDVVIYGVTLDNEGHTQVKQGSEADIIQFLNDLGIKVSRYMKHMAALSRVILLVEGDSDAKIIKKILHKFNRLEEFEKHRPLFVPLGGVEEASKIGRAVVDLISKGDDTLLTPSIPFLVILDRDENRQKQKDYEFILSVREIENLVITKKSVSKLVERFVQSLDIEFCDDVRNTFDLALAKAIDSYLNKWTLLIIRSKLGNQVRPILRRRSTGKLWEMTQEEVLDELSEEKEFIDKNLQEVSERYTKDYVIKTYDDLKHHCFDDSGKMNYDYIYNNLPGKVFLKYILPLALFDTVKSLHQEETEFSETKYRGLVGSTCNVDELLENCEEIPIDIERLLSRLMK